MIHQLFIAKSGMFAFQRKMQVITDNIANAQTPGFKGSRTEMESLFPYIMEQTITEFEDSSIPVGEKRKKYMQYGQGVRVNDVSRDLRQGVIEITNQPLDMAIEGVGFFQVRMPDGTLAYTRAGNFKSDNQGTIVDPNGHPLEPSVRLPNNMTDIAITDDGKIMVYVNNEAVPREAGQLLLAKFQNPAGMKSVGQNLYVESPASGEPVFENPGRNDMGRIRERALEFSNVDIIDQLTSMILTQRSFELIIKSTSAGDAMLKAASDIGK
ncbi:MAG: flagellar basal-body rod protein FlgG [Candidatus Margulisiibacteriota bacterium]